MSLESRIEEALMILKEARERFRRAYVMFSGGKDSLVVLDLASRVFSSDELKIVYIEITGNTAKCNIDYVYSIHRKYYSDYELLHLRSNYDFFDYMVRTGLPGLNARWCTRIFKFNLLRRIVPPIFIVGIKRSDSRFRARRYRQYIIANDIVHGISVLPLLNWSNSDVYEYIRMNSLPLNPCYEKYGVAGDCMFCPYHTKSAITRILQDPYWRQKILSYLNKIYSTSDYAKKIKKQWLKNNVVLNKSILEYG